ncbi:MAG TPA: fibronectin type III domain-containing protein, partial [Anaeromyxobacteraceae bacterium]|nr:fibronectin type III domain-containing protein [Anaeromyxobacteraceae bacterium]
VTWTAATGATSYNLQRATDSAFTVGLTTTNGDTSPYTDSTLTAGTTYWYRVVAVNAGGSTTGTGASVTTLPTAPGTPTFSATGFTATTVTWTAATGATSYNLQRASDSGFTTNLVTYSPATSPYTDSTLTAGTTYWFRAVAVNAGGSTNGAGASVTTSPLPGAPGTPTFSGTTGSATTVTWTAGTNATSYNLQRASDSGFTTNVVTYTGVTSPYTDSTLAGSTTYWYRAVAVNGGGSTNGTGASVTTLAGPPAAPAAPTYASVTQTTLTVNWTAAGGALTYNVQRSTDNATWTTLTTGLSVLTYNATTLTANTLYYFRVQAVNANGTTSGASSSVTTLAAPPGAPGTPTFSNIAAGSATITWTAGTGATSYNLQRATDTLFTQNLTTFTGVASPYNDGTLAGNTTYYYRAVAVNSGGSTTGASASMTTLAAPILTVAAGTMPAAANVAAGTTGTAIGQLSLTATSTGATLTTLSIQNLGTAVTDTDVVSLGLYNGTTFVAGSVWDSTTSRYDFNNLSIAVGATATVLNVKLNLNNGATGGRTFQMKVNAPADVAVVLPSSVATSTPTGNIFTITAGSLEANPIAAGPMVSVINPVKGAVISLAPAGNPAGAGFKVQVRVYDSGGISTIAANSVVVSTDNFTTTTVATQNANYNTGSPVTGTVYEAIINPAVGQYTLKARGADATVTNTSAGVPITVLAAGSGDGNLLVRDNSSQLCNDCHAVKPHSSENTSGKYGTWSTTCRDCHTPHSTRNIFLVNESITPPSVAGVQTAKQVGFVKATGDSNAAGLSGSAPSATASFVNSDSSGPCQVCHTRTASTGKTGTASFTNASGTVTASASVFASTDVNRSLLAPDGKVYTIQTYTSATVVVITPVYAGTTNAAGSFVVGDKRWRNTGNSDVHYTSAAGTQACTNCHAHTGGFAASCTGCHGTSGRASPAPETPPLDSCGNTASLAGSTTNRVGAHSAHLLGNGLSNGIACAQCHIDPPNRAGHPDNTKCSTSTAQTNNNRAVFTWGNLANGTKYAWSPAITVTPTYTYATQGCTNYCHGDFTNGNGTPTSVPRNTPTWNGTAACGSCHGTSATAPQPGGTHPTLTAGTTCQSCHGGTYNCAVGTACTSASIDKTLHINGKMDADCTGCHKGAIAANASLKFAAGRRAIVPEFTNSAGWSHKRSGGFTVTKWDCIVCHMEGD